MRLLLLFLLTLTSLAAAETYQDPNARKFYAEHPEFFHFAKPTDLLRVWPGRMAPNRRSSPTLAPSAAGCSAKA